MWRNSLLLFSIIGGIAAAQSEPVTEQITVYAPESFRFRTEDTAPKLVYDATFFRQFEPVTAGDILARIPGIAGTADAGEFDLAQMRGIGPQYTRVLINGNPVPGEGNDRTVKLDRIPAHLVSRVEIHRSPGADQDAQGIAGTINIILKDAAASTGFDFFGGLTHFSGDSQTHEQGSLTYRHAGDRLSYSITGSVQQRHNPKQQHTTITSFEALEDEEEPDDMEDEEDGESDKARQPTQLIKDENNIFDAHEKAFSGAFHTQFPQGGRLSGHMMVNRNERSEQEAAGISESGELVEQIFDEGNGIQENWGAGIKLEQPIETGMLTFELNHHRMRIDSRAEIGVIEDGQRLIEEVETDRTQDRTTQLSFAYRWQASANHDLAAGLDLSRREREARALFFEMDEEEQLSELETGGVFRIDEQRIDLFLSDSWLIAPAHRLQAGLRFEGTKLERGDRAKSNRNELFPSLHYLYKIGQHDRIRISYARTTKRPDFRDLQPFRQRNAPFDGQITLGNPELKAEIADGLDVGYEHHFARQQGIIGLNFYYRDIRELTEIRPIAEDTFRIENVGDGQTWGMELDLGMPLDLLKLPQISVYANASLQDSQFDDPISGARRAFNLQPETVYNLALLHTLPKAGVSYGLNWLSQGKADEILLTETGVLEVGETLDLFLEKKWGPWALRLSARNLTDGKRTLTFKEYDGLYTEGNITQSALETERAGRRIQLTLSGSF